MGVSNNVSKFKRQWLTLRKAARELKTDEEGLLKMLESGVAKDLPVYVHSEGDRFSGKCTSHKFASRMIGDSEFRESVADGGGYILLDQKRSHLADYGKACYDGPWFHLVGAFRVLPDTIQRIVRERALTPCLVAPASWWSDDGPVSINADGYPEVGFDVTSYDTGLGIHAVSFGSIRMDAEDLRDYIRSGSLVDAGKWPWGNHETEKLRHLEAAAKKYWANYDPDDPSSAETNETVVTWLMTERGVASRHMAEAIASILRADGLPTGPRKQVG